MRAKPKDPSIVPVRAYRPDGVWVMAMLEPCKVPNCHTKHHVFQLGYSEPKLNQIGRTGTGCMPQYQIVEIEPPDPDDPYNFVEPPTSSLDKFLAPATPGGD